MALLVASWSSAFLVVAEVAALLLNPSDVFLKPTPLALPVTLMYAIALFYLHFEQLSSGQFNYSPPLKLSAYPKHGDCRA